MAAMEASGMPHTILAKANAETPLNSVDAGIIRHKRDVNEISSYDHLESVAKILETLSEFY